MTCMYHTAVSMNFTILIFFVASEYFFTTSEMKERVSKLIYPTLQHCLRMLYKMNGNSKHYWEWLAIGQKRGYKLLLKYQISISCEYAYLHIMSFWIITTKYHAILLSGFRGGVLTNCFSSIFQFRQISKFKKRVIQRKKNEISCKYAYLHTMSFITTKFQEILLRSFRGVALTKKTGLTDWLTDWQTGQKHYTLRNSLRGV